MGLPKGRRSGRIRAKKYALQLVAPLALGEYLRNLGGCGRPYGPSAHQQFGRLRAQLCERRKGGDSAQGIGRSWGRRTAKIHALADRWYCLVRLMLTGGQVLDCLAAEPLLPCLPPDAFIVIGDKGYGQQYCASADRGQRSLTQHRAEEETPP